jgi:hypothetical protein
MENEYNTYEADSDVDSIHEPVYTSTINTAYRTPFGSLLNRFEYTPSLRRNLFTDISYNSENVNYTLFFNIDDIPNNDVSNNDVNDVNDVNEITMDSTMDSDTESDDEIVIEGYESE